MSLEVVIGPMFSGKSTYALSYIRRQESIGKKVLVIKPRIDNRYSQENVIVTHNYEKASCMLWDSNMPLKLTEFDLKHIDCVILDEAQFFIGLKRFVRHLITLFHKNVLIVGLDGDSNQTPFGEILECIPWATTVTKLNALCCKCKNGTLAPYTRRIDYDCSSQIDVGGSDKYESVCLKHLVHIQ